MSYSIVAGEAIAKHAKLMALGKAVNEQMGITERTPTEANQLKLQSLIKQRTDLVATMRPQLI